MTKSLLFVGYGYTARALARALGDDDWALRATARTDASEAKAAAEGISPFRWAPSGIDPQALTDLDAMLVSTPPAAKGCAAIGALSQAFATSAPRWIGYLSATSVYGDCGGAWVDETSPVRPCSERGRLRAAAEDAWNDFAAHIGARLVIFRLAGIYGPGRSALDAVKAGVAQRIVKPGQVFNRIHVADIAEALKASLERETASRIFNLADDEPAPPQDVVEYACRLTGAPLPPLVDHDDAVLSDMARSFYAENKRVWNARMKAELLPTLRFPTYREGLSSLA